MRVNLLHGVVFAVMLIVTAIASQRVGYDRGLSDGRRQASPSLPLAGCTNDLLGAGR